MESVKGLGVQLLILDGSLLVYHRFFPHRHFSGFPDNSPVPIYTPGCREALHVRVKCLAQEHNTITTSILELEPGPLDRSGVERAHGAIRRQRRPQQAQTFLRRERQLDSEVECSPGGGATPKKNWVEV